MARVIKKITQCLTFDKIKSMRNYDKQKDYYSKDRVICDDLTIIPPIVKVYEKPTLIKKLSNK